MPNQPRPDNPHRMVRVEDELWDAAKTACVKLGTTRSEVMRQALCEAVERASAKWPEGVPVDFDGRYAYGSAGPTPCVCGHDLVRHGSSLNPRCTACPSCLHFRAV